MIDFRYHLISIVAVLLALSIGIVMGTGVLGGPLLEDLKDRVEEVRTQNAELRDDINALQARISAQQEFAEATGEYLLPGRLAGEDVVVLEFEGVAGGLVDEVRNEVEDAGGRIASTISVSKKFGLADQTEIDQLALVLSSASSDPDELRREAAVAIGTQSSVVAGANDPTAADRVRLESLVEDLSDAGFVSVSRDDDAVTVPSGASFLVLGGAESLPQYDPAEFTVALTTTLSRGGAGVLVAETDASQWGMVVTILDDSEARDSVATVSGADRVQGRIAVVLGLERAIAGSPGHYGVGEGAEQPLPDPNS
ncbi:MAG: hypothetical protein QOH26_1689 [Actinomycetota bacterium]|nr:hypothetical protein [Actinomycetota bacterium]